MRIWNLAKKDPRWKEKCRKLRRTTDHSRAPKIRHARQQRGILKAHNWSYIRITKFLPPCNDTNNSFRSSRITRIRGFFGRIRPHSRYIYLNSNIRLANERKFQKNLTINSALRRARQPIGSKSTRALSIVRHVAIQNLRFQDFACSSWPDSSARELRLERATALWKALFIPILL